MSRVLRSLPIEPLTMEKHQVRLQPHNLVTIPPGEPMRDTFRRLRHQVEDIYHELSIPYKPVCKECGQPYLITRLYNGNIDSSKLCPACKPRPDNAPNEATHCECGMPTIIIARLATDNASEWYPLCAGCALLEALNQFEHRTFLHAT